MKKLFLAAFFTLAALATQAQTVTQEQLQGKWRLATLTNEYGTLDVIKGTWQLTKEGEAQKDIAEEMFNSVVLQGQEAVLTIKDDTASQIVMNQEYSSNYTLTDTNGKTYISMDAGTTGTPQIYVKDTKMYIVDEDIEMIYIAVK